MTSSIFINLDLIWFVETLPKRKNSEQILRSQFILACWCFQKTQQIRELRCPDEGAFHLRHCRLGHNLSYILPKFILEQTG